MRYRSYHGSNGYRDEKGKRLLTFTLEAEVRVVRQVVAKYDNENGRPYRLVALGHPGAAK
ncbi:MAG TPA: hypothetical protein VH352_20770 [Pseudonocardiaceae bacterium]|nr:hypothetical protein [Pseudonocardiaceae bacterium]